MSGPPPPPPHGESPKSTAGSPPGSGLPPGKYDIFIIPPHSSGSGFLYLPSLQPNVNSFAAGYAACLLTILVLWGLSPTVLPWWNTVKSQGGPGMILLLIAVGVGSWAGGRLFAEHASGQASGGFPNGSANGGFGGGGNAGGSTPNGFPGGYANTPPPGTGPMPGAGGTHGSGPMPGSANGGQRWQRGAPPGSTRAESDSNTDGGASESARASWERAREETKRKEDERKAREADRRAKEAEKKRKEEADEKLRQQREKENREREAREQEAQARRREAEAELQRKKVEAEDQERRKKEAEALDKLRRERELAEKRLSEAREREVRERDLREKRKIDDEARAKRLKEAEAREKKRKEDEAAKKAAVEAAKKKLDEGASPRGTAYAFSATGEKTNPWPHGRPKTPPPARSNPPSPTKRPPPPTARTYKGTDDGYSYRPYDKKPVRKNSFNSSYSHSSYSPSQSTSKTTPPPSQRAPYSTKDPNKIVIKAVYAFSNTFKGPTTQLVAGVGSVSDGLILNMTTEGLFIDDDVRNVAQREWDVKAWTMKLVEVWCPAFRQSDPRVPASSARAQKSSVRRLWGLDKEKPATSEETDALVNSMLSLCKDNCRLHAASSANFASGAASEYSDSAYGSVNGDSTDNRGAHQTGDLKKLHVLRASVRDDQGTKYVFVIDEGESWKVALGLQKLRKGSQVRALGVSGMSANESKNILESLGWGA